MTATRDNKTMPQVLTFPNPSPVSRSGGRAREKNSPTRTTWPCAQPIPTRASSAPRNEKIAIVHPAGYSPSIFVRVKSSPN